MFKTDQTAIQSFASKSPENTARVVEFTLHTIQRNFEIAVEMSAGKREVFGTRTMFDGINYARANMRRLHEVLMTAARFSDIDAMIECCVIPGIGIAKAGFIVQMCRGTVGCLDSHNMKMYGLDPQQFRMSPSASVLRGKIETYIGVCNRLGGSEILWDSWCAHVAKLRPKVWRSADHVSGAHVFAVCGK